jgi:uncharacterized membrane protein (DUF2068 family)
VDWSLLGCGRYGHVTFAPDEPDLRAELHARLAAGDAWRCLRCGTFVPGQPHLSGPVSAAPAVEQGSQIRSKLILRLFAIERFLRALVVLAISYGLFRYRSSRLSVEAAFDRDLPIVRDLFRQLGYNIEHSKLFGLLQHALTLSSGTLTLLALGALVYGVVEVIEGTGLWLARRWGEYFAMVATSLGLPLEIYDLTRKVTITALVLFAINLALVLYLVITKRLFGVRGGKSAYDARLRSESVLEAAERAVAARDAVPPAATAAGASSRPADPQPAPGRQPAPDRAAASPEAATETQPAAGRRAAADPRAAAYPQPAADPQPARGSAGRDS